VQVLSNDQLRAAYDRDGAESSSLETATFVDPALFFNMLFGSDKFEPYVGRLKLAAFASVAAGGVDHAWGSKEGLHHAHALDRWVTVIGLDAVLIHTCKCDGLLCQAMWRQARRSTWRASGGERRLCACRTLER
jgi:hypothetical protein